MRKVNVIVCVGSSIYVCCIYFIWYMMIGWGDSVRNMEV